MRALRRTWGQHPRPTLVPTRDPKHTSVPRKSAILQGIICPPDPCPFALVSIRISPYPPNCHLFLSLVESPNSCPERSPLRSALLASGSSRKGSRFPDLKSLLSPNRPKSIVFNHPIAISRKLNRPRAGPLPFFPKSRGQGVPNAWPACFCRGGKQNHGGLPLLPAGPTKGPRYEKIRAAKRQMSVHCPFLVFAPVPSTAEGGPSRPPCSREVSSREDPGKCSPGPGHGPLPVSPGQPQASHLGKSLAGFVIAFGDPRQHLWSTSPICDGPDREKDHKKINHIRLRPKTKNEKVEILISSGGTRVGVRPPGFFFFLLSFAKIGQ